MGMMPNHGLDTCPSSINSVNIDFTVLIGTANPIPCPYGIFAVFIATTSPLVLISGPPELPGLIAASVCTTPRSHSQIVHFY